MRKIRLTLIASAAALLCFGLAPPTALSAPVEADAAGPGDPTTMIIGGEDATTPYSFMVSVQKGQNQHFCGGSLLNEQWFVTAAHCVEKEQPGDLQVRVGSLRTDEGGSARGVDRIVLHPDRDLDSFDVALVRLDQPVTNEPVPLDVRQPAGTPTRLLGWGCTVTGPNTGCTLPEILQQLDSAIRQPAACVNVAAPIDPASEVCTGNPDTKAGPCFADSGGPLLRGTPAGWRLIGAFSRVESLPRDPDKPGPQLPDCSTGKGIYTDVTVQREWIDSVISAA